MKRPRAIARRRWSAEEEHALRLAWGEVRPETLLQRFPGRTWQAIWQHAVTALGLPRGVPQGHETLRSAAKRTGYSIHQLWEILGAANVRVRYWYGGGRTSSHVGGREFPRNPWRAVDPLEVDAAVARWCRLETVATAARRLAMSPQGLQRVLRAAGLLPPAEPGRRPHARLDPHDIDHALAARRRAA